MNLVNSFFITRKEKPKEEKLINASLLIQSGMIIKNDVGIYTYTPMGLKVLNNISNIIRNEMNNNYAQEVLMPSLVSSETFGMNKNNIFDTEMYRVIDRNNKDLVLCPSHAELFVNLAKNKVKSYKDLHFTLFQISNKYRDELHPEFGLIRKKEFYMADAYSFDSNESGLDISYDKMFQTFNRIFDKLGINATVVDANADEENGLSSEEFQVITPYGDNEVVRCTNCTFTANRETVVCKNITKLDAERVSKMKLVKTPNSKTVKEVSDYLKIHTDKIIKSLIIKVDDIYKMILLRGESQLNIYKLRKLVGSKRIEIPSEDELEKIGTYAGYIGPIDTTMEVLADNEVKYMIDGVCGANKKDYHYMNVIPGRDFRVNKYYDLKLFDDNSVCPRCKNKCEIIKGIEIGQIFKLGNKYSQEYGLKYTDEANYVNYVQMGSYNIGIDRCLGAIVEQNYDEKGIIWPLSVAPFKVCIVIANVNDQFSFRYAYKLYDKLNSMGIETLIDDRKETIGTKFADMDLIGIPIRITVGYKLKDNEVELKLRTEEETRFISTSNIINEVVDIIEYNN